ncbi:hypothetical protein BZARG_03665 [Bizionia argentinensis JUB59]|uniref:Undecaprenyl/decaprenyl-phosphate alpha-N-acetylglucosaminyl 1-phosphate transferase n=1 Tax=Bizionia argentinensis JUB59 TaxID=1046627 RepID=A0A4U8UJ61_9FLAO|nr:hypothetical protein BZARG_03665 [Bizionia argentinensis JUB59]
MLLQLLIALISILEISIYIHSFACLFTINDLPTIFAIISTVFVTVLGINSYNLIDGLAG